MNTRTRLKSILFVLLTVVTAWLVVGYYQRARSHEERLSHDSRAIETMLSESSSLSP